MTDYTVIQGDVADVCDDLDGFDAVLCDPPYGLGDPVLGDEMVELLQAWLDGQGYDAGGGGFMDRDWDSSVIDPPDWQAIREVCKPGAFMASFGGTRTFDLQSVAQRIAGWEMRDEVLALAWAYGSGFPKSHDVGAAIDDVKGAERDVVGTEYEGNGNGSVDGTYGSYEAGHDGVPVTAPATPAAEQFDGYGTALAPAHEPIGLWRKPTDKTYAECALEEGCGCLNIDGARVPADDNVTRDRDTEGGDSLFGMGAGGGDVVPTDKGRWPANTVLVHHPACGEQCHADCHVRRMDEMSGDRSSPSSYERSASAEGRWLHAKQEGSYQHGYGDSGGASRFFPRFRYMAKAARSEREAGLFSRETQTVDDGRDEPIDNAYQRGETERKNTHPCVKPIMLCKWIATLLLPPERDKPRRLLVPFSGSGSEMIGAMLAGWDEVVGIERDGEYVDIARDRLAWWDEHGEGAVEAHKAEQKRREHERETGQTSLLEVTS